MPMVRIVSKLARMLCGRMRGVREQSGDARMNSEESRELEVCSHGAVVIIDAEAWPTAIGLEADEALELGWEIVNVALAAQQAHESQAEHERPWG